MICEAFEVLSHNERKATFDKYGEYGLKNGVTSHDGKTIAPYMWLGNSASICAEFFARTHLDGEVFEFDGSDIYGSLAADGHRGKNQPRPPAPKNIEVTLKCSMEELYNGSMKQLVYTRTKIHPDGRTKT